MAVELHDVLSSFPLFPNLPSEIRQMIWEHALPGPRIVYLQHHSPPSMSPYAYQAALGDDRPSSQPDAPPKIFRSKSTIPLASACRESRNVVEETYNLAFGTDGAPAATWFDFSRDTLYLNWGGNWETETASWDSQYSIEDLGDDVARVENLAVYARRISGFVVNQGSVHQFSRWISRTLTRFGGIKLLSLVDGEHGIAGEDLVLVNQCGISAMTSIYEMAEVYHPDIEQQVIETEGRFINERLFLNAHLDLSILEAYRNGQFEDERSPLFEPCSIQWQGITTRGVKKKYERVKEEYDAKKEDYRVSLLLRSANHRAIMIAIRETTPLSEIVEEYRSTVGVSHKSVFVSILLGDGVLDPRLNSFNYRLMSGTTLDIIFSDKTA
jgi:hypothetical protein